jgi:hypothetical protein
LSQAQIIDDGGPAFPLIESSFSSGGTMTSLTGRGMSMRDWFAGQALAGLLGNDTFMTDLQAQLREDGRDSGGQRSGTCVITARRAYMHADAMLAARKEPPKP